MKDKKSLEPTDSRVCPCCERELVVGDNFYWTKRDGWYTYCKTCTRDNNRTRRTSADRRRWHLKATYGLSQEQFDAMWAEQDGKCKICSVGLALKTGGFAVDHCHASGKIRSLLCSGCNTTLGNCRDDIDLLGKLIEYLRSHASE